MELSPTEWDWELINGQLHPVLPRQPPAPEQLYTLFPAIAKEVVSDLVAARNQIYSVQFYVAIVMEMVAAILTKTVICLSDTE